MQKWKRRFIILGTTALFLSIVYIIFNFVFLDFLVNYWWFASLNYEVYYLKRLFYRDITFAAVFVFFTLVFFFNFWFASRYLGTSSAARAHMENLEARKRYQKVFHNFQSGSMKIYTPISLLLALPIAIHFYEKWEEGLLWFFAPGSGVQDPAFGKDISYYLFSYPVHTFVQNELLIAFSLLFPALLLLYAIEWRLLKRDQQPFPKAAKIHLTVIAAVVVMIETWGILLQRIELVYADTHLPRFFGPGFVEMWLEVPLIWTTAALFLATGFFLIYYAHKRKGTVTVLILVVLLATVVSLRTTDFFSDLLQNFIVKPNEAVRERPYIQRSIESTLRAFDLERAEIRDFPIGPVTELSDDAALQKTLRNIPVWDRELLDDVYTQIQSFHRYYTFPNVDVDRYTVNGVYQQVYLSARELSVEGVPDAARNWINTHLQYTHGYGIVMTPAVQGGDDPMTWFVRDIPLVSDFGFSVAQPGIYYGEEKYNQFVIAPNDMGEIDIQEKAVTPADRVNYSGKGGIPLSSFWKKLLFSVYFKDKDIFFTPKTNKDSRILFRRNITDAIQTITPFFLLDKDPYIVNTSNGLFWIVDGYTASSRYPNAHRYTRTMAARDFGNTEFNYLRNSVKIAVDAYNGTISYYISDPADPIVGAYQRIYPSLLKNMDEMPGELKAHLRYPRQIFTVQMDVYAKYHQTDPDMFYREEDTWEFAKMGGLPVAPYYMALTILDTKDPEFILVSPMSPVGRDNLRSLAVARCDAENYGKIVILSFPKGRQVFGPSQISALVNQDTDIAQELTLWDQAGSEVRFGRMIMLPMKNGLLYIQPLYTRSATGLKIPELKRIIVSQGDMAVMDRTVKGALQKLEARLKERDVRVKQRGHIQEQPGEPHPAPPPETVPAPAPIPMQHGADVPVQGGMKQPSAPAPQPAQIPVQDKRMEQAPSPAPQPAQVPEKSGADQVPAPERTPVQVPEQQSRTEQVPAPETPSAQVPEQQNRTEQVSVQDDRTDQAPAPQAPPAENAEPEHVSPPEAHPAPDRGGEGNSK